MYVTDLVAPGHVNTMPEATLHAVADHGEIHGDTIHGHLRPRPGSVFEQLARSGVDYDDVVQVLEDEGVEKFARLLEPAASRRSRREMAKPGGATT